MNNLLWIGGLHFKYNTLQVNNQIDFCGNKLVSELNKKYNGRGGLVVDGVRILGLEVVPASETFKVSV